LAALHALLLRLAQAYSISLEDLSNGSPFSAAQAVRLVASIDNAAAAAELQRQLGLVDRQALAVRRAHALAQRRCSYLGCCNMGGVSERSLHCGRCSACRTARYCGAECMKADWRAHKPACKLLRTAAAAAQPE